MQRSSAVNTVRGQASRASYVWRRSWHPVLVPTFRSSCTIAAPTFHELRKAMGTSKLMILVPFFDLKSLG